MIICKEDIFSTIKKCVVFLFEIVRIWALEYVFWLPSPSFSLGHSFYTSLHVEHRFSNWALPPSGRRWNGPGGR